MIGAWLWLRHRASRNVMLDAAPAAARDPAPIAARERRKPDDHPLWKQVLGAVAAAAGGAAWISALGSAIVAQRLDSVDLPVESVVALMSPEHRFVIGAGYLVAPIFVGLVGFLAVLSSGGWLSRTGALNRTGAYHSRSAAYC